MAKSEFKSFAEVASYFDVSQKALEKANNSALKDIGKYLKMRIQSKYGKQQPGWPKTTNPTPLVDSGKLKASVYYLVAGGEVTLGTTEEWLATIHEYGITFRMTEQQRKFLFATVFKKAGAKTGRPRTTHKGFIVIPARPIWRVILDSEDIMIATIYSGYLDTIFQ